MSGRKSRDSDFGVVIRHVAGSHPPAFSFSLLDHSGGLADEYLYRSPDTFPSRADAFAAAERLIARALEMGMTIFADFHEVVGIEAE